MTDFKPNTCQTCALLHDSINPCSRCIHSVFKTSETGRTDLWQPVNWFLEIQQLEKELDAEKDVNAMRKRRAGTCQVCGTECDLTISWTFDAWICDSCMDKQMENYVLYRNLKEQLKVTKDELNAANAEKVRLTGILERNGYNAKTGKPPLGPYPTRVILEDEIKKLTEQRDWLLQHDNDSIVKKERDDLQAFKNKIVKLYVENHEQAPDKPCVKVTDDLVLGWIDELVKKIKVSTIGVDEFDDLVGDIACSSAHYFASLFQSFAKIDEIADGQYEDMKDATYALARLVARALGFTLGDMEKAHMHEIEKDLADYNTPVCPNNCDFVNTCKEKPMFHHIRNKMECVVWHMKKPIK